MIWPELTQGLLEKYQIKGTVNLVNSATNPIGIFKKIKQIAQDSYDENERIVVQHYDTDFYFGRNGVGLHNFLTCLTHYQISPSKVIFLTNHPGIDSEILLYYQHNYPRHNYDIDQINVVVNNYTTFQTIIDPIRLSPDYDSIDHHYICLCGSPRTHRKLFLSLLNHYNLLDQGIVTWHFDHNFNSPLKKLKNKSNLDINDVASVPNNLLSTSTNARFNDWKIKSEFHDHCWQQSQNLFNTSHTSNLVDTIPYKHNEIDTNNLFTIPAVLKAFVYISIESVFDYPYPYLTEKTFRGITHFRPFVIIGAPGSIKRLHDMGFKTFDNWWDESYDCILDHSQRMDAITNIVKDINSKNLSQLKAMCYTMNSVLQHNYQHYVEYFCGTHLKETINRL
jgi:hypothetical protein